MTNDAHDELTEETVAVLGATLSREDVWEELPPELEDAVVNTIAMQAATSPAPTAASDAATVTSLTERRRTRPSVWLAAAAAAVLVIGGFVVSRGGSDDGVEVALASTEAAPGSSAVARLSATPAGLKILLDVDGLPGAPDGSFYEAWISDGTTRVSAGTFHLRDGDGEIELWAGVADASFDRFSITLEPLDGVADSSGNVVLNGRFDLDG